MERKQNRRKILKKLSNRYRLLIINETNFQEKTSLSLTPFNVLLISSAGLLLFSLISWGIYTLFPGVKDYAPGYGQTFDGKMKNEVLKKISKLENELEMAQKRELAMKQIINGEDVTAYEIPFSAGKAAEPGIVSKDPKTEKRQTPMQAEKPAAEPRSSGNAIIPEDYPSEDLLGNEFLFFTPLSGEIGSAFNAVKPFVDIIPQLDETVKATMDGTVIFSGWTPEYGFIISVQHQNNWMSVYKFNAAVYKEPGTFVKAGETIGITGYTDKANQSKKLRFELWHNGLAMDPVNYIVF